MTLKSKQKIETLNKLCEISKCKYNCYSCAIFWAIEKARGGNDKNALTVACTNMTGITMPLRPGKGIK